MEKGRIEFPITSLEPRGNSFLHKLKLRIFQDHLKKRCSPMEKGRIEFLIKFLELGRNFEPNGNAQIFFYINQRIEGGSNI